MIIRAEQPGDERSIEDVVREAFAKAVHSSGTEPSIVNALRNSGALSVSLVAVEAAEIIGHVAASRVVLQSSGAQWYGLGPVSVRPRWQRCGIGRQLIEALLDRLRGSGAGGCVVLGEPSYYGQFGFRHKSSLSYRDVPPPYFQFLSFTDEEPSGPVEYHAAFEVAM